MSASAPTPAPAPASTQAQAAGLLADWRVRHAASIA